MLSKRLFTCFTYFSKLLKYWRMFVILIDHLITIMWHWSVHCSITLKLCLKHWSLIFFYSLPKASHYLFLMVLRSTWEAWPPHPKQLSQKRLWSERLGPVTSQFVFSQWWQMSLVLTGPLSHAPWLRQQPPAAPVSWVTWVKQPISGHSFIK